MMPRLDGLGLLKEIRADEALRGTPVILLSARAGSEAAAGGIEAGADDYVVKPFTPGELLARCRTSLELADYRARAAAGQVRGALLAGVSHDMQTPLAVITTSLGLLGETDLADEDRTRIASRARARASQLTRLVTQFLDWSRLSMNQPLPIRIELVDLAVLVRAVASEHDGIRVTGDEVATEIRCDRQRTEQILHNLVENAKRVAASGIEIRLGGDEDDLTVRVVDDGPGVSPEVLARLFEAFGPSTAQKGSGLGLHVSREAARAQGGELVLESTGPEGSVFLLRLPRHRARLTGPASSARQPSWSCTAIPAYDGTRAASASTTSRARTIAACPGPKKVCLRCTGSGPRSWVSTARRHGMPSRSAVARLVRATSMMLSGPVGDVAEAEQRHGVHEAQHRLVQRGAGGRGDLVQPEGEVRLQPQRTGRGEPPQRRRRTRPPPPARRASQSVRAQGSTSRWTPSKTCIAHTARAQPRACSEWSTQSRVATQRRDRDAGSVRRLDDLARPPHVGDRGEVGPHREEELVHPVTHRPRHQLAGRRPLPHPGGASHGVGQPNRSMIVTLACPPPSHIVCRP